MSQEQREKLRATQLAYVANDPRWQEHREKLVSSNLRRFFTLTQEEVSQVVAMRKKGRNFGYVAEELCVCKDVLRRELKRMGVDYSIKPSPKRVQKGNGPWRSFEPAEVASLRI